jgi:flagellar biosynthesis/type III secretory pathway protein FliH
VVLQFNYTVIQLNQLNWRDFLQQENPTAAALMAKMKIEPSDRRRVKYECLRLLATLKLNPAKMKLISGFVDTYLKLNAEEERLFKADIAEMIPETREVVMEIVTSWMEEGIEQGIQQGIQQGMQREIQVVVQRLLSKRIGNISPELQARISQLSFSQLEELAEAVLDFSSVADLVTWLQGVSA